MNLQGAEDEPVRGLAAAYSSRSAIVHGRCASFVFTSLVLVAIAIRGSSASAQARDSRWLVMPSVVATQGDPKHPARAAAQVMTEALRGHGKHAFSIEEAKSLFEQHGSTPPMTASAADIDELAKDAQRALYHVASGLPQRAKKDVERALDRARRALESLNRETRAAQHLLDACLYLVRAHLQHKDRAEARAQALECRRLVPDIAPEPTVHPPDVIGVLAEAQAQLLMHEPASLRIESEPMGCAAYVNGRNLGPTPRELSQLSPGEYRLQVECEPGVMGRVHRVPLTSQRYVAKVDTRYDRAIETLFDLSLNYPARDEERRRLGRDAVETARIIGASDVVVAWVKSPSGAPTAQVQLDRYRVSDGVHLAQTTVQVDPGRGTIASAVVERARVELTDPAKSRSPAIAAAAAIAPPQSLAKPAPPIARPEPARAQPVAPLAQPLATPAPEPEPVAAPMLTEYEQPKDDGNDAWPIAGYAIGGVGLTAHVASWVLYASLLGEQASYTDALNMNAMPTTATSEELTALRDVDSAEPAPFIAGGVGAVLSTAALPMWLPDANEPRDGIPWWGWTVGGVGAVLVGTGAVLAANESSCLIDRYMRCTEPALATHVGPMILLQAVPLLAVPIVQGVRALTGGSASARVQVGTAGALFQIEGRM